MLWQKSDDEMRPYANMFLVHLVNCLNQNDPSEREQLQEIVYNMMKVQQGDHQLAITASAHDYAENMEDRAVFWIKRMNIIQKL